MLRPRLGLTGAAIGVCTVLVITPVLADSGVALVEINGVPLAVTEQTVPGHAEQIARVLQSRWRRETPAAWIGWHRLGDRYIVSRLRGVLHETASVRPAADGRGSRVVIGVRDMRASVRPAPTVPVALPYASRWLSSAQPMGAGAASTSEWLAFTGRPLPAARRDWRASLHRAGWRERIDGGMSGALFEREGETILLHLHPAGRGTSVVLQQRRRSMP